MVANIYATNGLRKFICNNFLVVQCRELELLLEKLLQWCLWDKAW